MLAEIAVVLSLATTGQSPGIGLNVADLCRYVAENISETRDPGFARFVYQTRIYRAAGIDPAVDDAATIRAKMQVWWNHHRTELICNVPNSVVRDGNILKLAVDRSSTDFLNDVSRRWRLDLNQIDRDGKTVLDFAEEQLEASRGSPREATLNRYSNILESVGALRARDLPQP